MCLGPVQLSKALITPIHRSPTLNGILPKLTGVKYLMLIDASSGYHNLKLDEKLSYLRTLPCSFGRYGYIRMPFGATPGGDMFQRRIDELFNDIPYVFGIADDFLIARFDADGRNHDVSLEQA